MRFYQNIKTILKKKWMRLVSRGSNIRYSNEYKKFDAIYIVKDPWQADSSSQMYRFIETNRVILDKFGRVNSLLEIDCGEDHQSLHLQQVCNNLTGLDVSVRAINRARKRCPGSDFLAGDIFSKDLIKQVPFDLMVACEVLYYMSDVQAALRQMLELARNIVVTYFYGEMKNLDPIVLSMHDCGSEVLESEYGRWRIAWFQGKQF